MYHIIDLCIDHGITIVTLQPHCSHRMQPLDVSVFGPVKKTYDVRVHVWGLSNAGRTFEIQHVAGMVDKALIASCTPLNIRKGFAATGIFPVNSDIFTDDDFLAASISGENLMAEEPVEKSDVRHILIVQDNEMDIDHTEEVTRTASDVASTSTASTSVASTSVDFRSTLGDIGPVQIAAPTKKSNRGRKPTKSTILTSSEKRSEMQQMTDNRAKKGSKAKPSPRKGKSSKQPAD